MMTEVVERMISKNPPGKIATEENMFKHLKETYPNLAMQDSTYISNNVVNAWIGINTSAVKWNWTVGNKHETFLRQWQWQYRQRLAHPRDKPKYRHRIYDQLLKNVLMMVTNFTLIKRLIKIQTKKGKLEW